MTDEELGKELVTVFRNTPANNGNADYIATGRRARTILAARPEVTREDVEKWIRDKCPVGSLAFKILAAIPHFAPPREARPIDGMSVISAGLSALSEEVRATWRAEDYPVDAQSDEAQFRHAAIHAMKALGKISALIDHADHERLDVTEAAELSGELPKLLADLLRCTAKMAEKAPDGSVDMAGAYAGRAAQLAERWGHSLAQPAPVVDADAEAKAVMWAWYKGTGRTKFAHPDEKWADLSGDDQDGWRALAAQKEAGRE